MLTLKIKAATAVRELDESKLFKNKRIDAKNYTVMSLIPGKELTYFLYEKAALQREKKEEREYIRLEKDQRLTLFQKYILVLLMVKSVNELHHKNILHCDLKPGNFVALVEGNNISCTLIDYGLSVIYSPIQRRKVEKLDFKNSKVPRGTPGYQAPEVYNSELLNDETDFFSVAGPGITKSVYSRASDTYSLGRIFHEDFELDKTWISEEVYEMLCEEHEERLPLDLVAYKIAEKIEKEYPEELAASGLNKSIVENMKKNIQEALNFLNQEIVLPMRENKWSFHTNVFSDNLVITQLLITNISQNEVSYLAEKLRDVGIDTAQCKNDNDNIDLRFRNLQQGIEKLFTCVEKSKKNNRVMSSRIDDIVGARARSISNPMIFSSITPNSLLISGSKSPTKLQSSRGQKGKENVAPFAKKLVF